MGISRDSRHKRRATGGKRKAYRKKRKFELGRPAANTKIGEKRIHLVRGRGGNLKYRALRLETGNFSWGSEVITRKSRILGVVYNASNNELVRTNTLVKNSIIQIDSSPFRSWYEQHYGIALGKKKATESKAGAKDSKAGAKDSKKGAAKDSKAKPVAAAKDSKADPKAAAKKAEPKAAAKATSAKKAEPKAAAKKGAAAKKATHTGETKKLTAAQQSRQSGRTLDPLLAEQLGTGRLYVAISSRPGQSGRCDGYVLEGKELEFYLKKLQKKKKN